MVALQSRFAGDARAVALIAAGVLGFAGIAAAQNEPQWKSLVEAANKEGEVQVIVGPGASFREGVEGFAKSFPNIKLNVTGQHIRDALPRILREREAGVYSADVMIGAVGAGVFSEWIPKGVLTPLKPHLIRADVLDESKWICGLNWGWMDKSKEYNVGFSATALPGLYVNRDQVPETQLPFDSPVETLAKKEFQGKISWEDPRELGSGQNAAALFLRLRSEEFLTNLIKEQKPVFTRDGRQQVDWAVRGRYPIALGLNATILKEFQTDGLGKNVQPIKFKDGDMIIPGFGVLAMFDKAPHPNAAKVFANWMLTQEAQEQYHKATNDNSRRKDVPFFSPQTAPKDVKCDTALDLQKEDFAEIRSRGGKVSAAAYEQAK
jgi:iron(III) transport system substrate-binding protein